MAKLLVLNTSAAYAASLTSSAADAATSPELLALGTVGVYGINPATQKVALITSTPSIHPELASIYQGNGTPMASVNLQPNNVFSIKKQAYVAPVSTIAFIGYNGTNSSLNLPTIVQNDEAVLEAILYEASDDFQMREQENYTSGVLTAGQAAYDIMAKLALNVNNREELTHVAFPVSNDTVAAFTGTGTGVLLTKGSTTVNFTIGHATTGVQASTGSINAGDIINVPSSNYRKFSFVTTGFTVSATLTVGLGGTLYVVPAATSDANTATVMAAAINTGTQATAVVTSSTTVTVTANTDTYFAMPLVYFFNGTATYSQVAITTIDAETVPVKLRALALVSAASSFELDTPYQGETGYFVEGTSATANAGVATTGTQWGLKLKALTKGNVYGYSTQLVIQNATKTVAVGASEGSGSYDQIAALEKEAAAYKGQFDTVDRRMKYIPLFADSTKVYDTYTFLFTNRTEDKSAAHSAAYQESFTVAFVKGHTSEANFETVIKYVFPNAVVNF